MRREWLAKRPGVRLIAAAARPDLGPDGEQQKRETLHGRYNLSWPDR